MKSVHVIAGLGAKNGGPAYSVPRLAQALSHQGCHVDLYTVSEKADEPTKPNVFTFPPDFPSVPVVSSLRLSRYLTTELAKYAWHSDILHNHGLWLMPNVTVGRIAAKVGKPLVVSPRGMLAPEALRISAYNKKLFWAFLQQPALAHAAVWHATSPREAEDIRAFGVRAPIVVIPNGVDAANVVAEHSVEKEKRTLLFLSRIHPIKGLSTLISAWAEIAAQRPCWELVIAGPDDGGHLVELRKLVEKAGVTSIRFEGPVYGSNKSQLLASADLFVLPTKSENFGIAVAEALAAGLPAIVTKGAPWSGLNEERCGWWIDHGIEPLKIALLEATALPSSARKEMGRRGRDWIARDFSWDAISLQMKQVYDWVLSQAPPPVCVHPV